MECTRCGLPFLSDEAAFRTDAGTYVHNTKRTCLERLTAELAVANAILQAESWRADAFTAKCDALEMYAEHTEDCRGQPAYGIPCDCGLAALLPAKSAEIEQPRKYTDAERYRFANSCGGYVFHADPTINSAQIDAALAAKGE